MADWASRNSQVIINGDLELTSGQEWYSDQFDVRARSIIRVKSDGNQKFYVGVYAEEVFQRLHNSNPSTFPFNFGSDRQDIDEAYVARIDGLHRVVVRLGVFTPSGKTNLLVEVIGPRPDGR